jgi:hypothetical protein
MPPKFEAPLLEGATSLAKEIQHRRQTAVADRILTWSPHTPFYIDEIPMEDVLGSNSPNLIGTAVRDLLRKKRLKKTGKFRKSTKAGSKGRVIFQMVVVPA